jgi:hypothetical protein
MVLLTAHLFSVFHHKDRWPRRGVKRFRIWGGKKKHRTLATHSNSETGATNILTIFQLAHKFTPTIVPLTAKRVSPLRLLTDILSQQYTLQVKHQNSRPKEWASNFAAWRQQFTSAPNQKREIAAFLCVRTYVRRWLSSNQKRHISKAARDVEHIREKWRYRLLEYQYRVHPVSENRSERDKHLRSLFMQIRSYYH